MQSLQQLFASLSVSTKFAEGLRPGQKKSCDSYDDLNADQKVVSIELPTGAGKTVIGLLAAEAHRDDNKSVAYLCVNEALAERVAEEAKDLGIRAAYIPGAGATDDPSQREQDLDDYRYCDLIGVFSYASFLRGKGVPPADVVIVDDAHAFEDEVVRRASLTVWKNEHDGLYKNILRMVGKESSLRHLVETFLLPGMVNQDAIQLIPFHVVHRLDARLREMLQAAAETEAKSQLRWELPVLGPRLADYLMVISRDSIAFRPYIASVWDMTVGYGSTRTFEETVERLVLMSATLGTEVSLKERFGVIEPVARIWVDANDGQDRTMGERIIVPLVDTGVAANLDERGARLVSNIVRDFGKALVLVNSGADAKLVKGTLRKTKVDEQPDEYKGVANVETFKAREKGALIAANRVLGLDLGGKWCNVGVQVRLPYVLDPLDGLKQAIPRDEALINEKVAHRLAQAFGRLNRGPHDRAVYFVLDERFAGEMRQPEFFAHLPVELRAQTLLGWREGGAAKPYAEKQAFAKSFLEGKLVDYAKLLEKYRVRTLKDNVLPATHKPKYINDMIQAWRFVDHARLPDAAKLLEEIAKKTRADVPEVAAWHLYLAVQMQYMAAQKQGAIFDAKRASAMLEDAYKLAKGPWASMLPGVVTSLRGSPPDSGPITPRALEAKRRVAENWRQLRKRAVADERDKEALAARVDRAIQHIKTGSHGEICVLLQEFHELAGFDRVIRERAEGENLDVVAYSTIEEPPFAVVLEVKTREKDETQVISKEIDQVVADARAQLQEGTIYTQSLPVIATNRDLVHPDAMENARKCGVRILTAPVMEKLVRDYYSLVEKFWEYDAQGQAESMIPNLPSPAGFLRLYRSTGTPVISEDEVPAVMKL